MFKFIQFSAFATFIALVFTVSPAITSAYAQDELSAEEIAAKLKKKPLTRSLKGDGGISKQDEMELRDALSRSIGVRERKKIAEITTKVKSPTLDFSIQFDFDSADIGHESYRTLDKLAVAISGDELSRDSFLINGHTDSKGTDDYNQDLSERRAAAVAAYLMERHGIDSYRLKPIGYGEEQLKDEHDGEAAANRRVEIVNLPVNLAGNN